MDRYQQFLQTLRQGLGELQIEPAELEVAGYPRGTFNVLLRAFRSSLPSHLQDNLRKFKHDLNDPEYLRALSQCVEALSPGGIAPLPEGLAPTVPSTSALAAFEEAKRLHGEVQERKASQQERFKTQVAEYNQKLRQRLQGQLKEDFPELTAEKAAAVAGAVAESVNIQEGLAQVSGPYEEASQFVLKKIGQQVKAALGDYLPNDERIEQFSQMVASGEGEEAWRLRETQILAEEGPADYALRSQIHTAVISSLPPSMAPEKKQAVAEEVTNQVISHLPITGTEEGFQSAYEQEVEAAVKFVASPDFKYREEPTAAAAEEFIEAARQEVAAPEGITAEEGAAAASQWAEAVIAASQDTAIVENIKRYVESPQSKMSGGMPQTMAQTMPQPTILQGVVAPPAEEERDTSGIWPTVARFKEGWTASHPTDFLFFGLSKPSLKTLPLATVALGMDLVGFIPAVQTPMTLGYLNYHPQKLQEVIDKYTNAVSKYPEGSRKRATYQSMVDLLTGIKTLKQNCPPALRPFLALGGFYGWFQETMFNISKVTGISPLQLLEWTAEYGGEGFTYGLKTGIKIGAARLVGAALHAALPKLFLYDEKTLSVYFAYGPKAVMIKARNVAFGKAKKFIKEGAKKVAKTLAKTTVGKAIVAVAIKIAAKIGISVIAAGLTGGASAVIQTLLFVAGVMWDIFKKVFKYLAAAAAIFILWIIHVLGTIFGSAILGIGALGGALVGSFFGPVGAIAGFFVGPVVLGSLSSLLGGTFFGAGAATTGVTAIGAAGATGIVSVLSTYAIIAPAAIAGIGITSFIAAIVTATSLITPLKTEPIKPPIYIQFGLGGGSSGGTSSSTTGTTTPGSSTTTPGGTSSTPGSTTNNFPTPPPGVESTAPWGLPLRGSVCLAQDIGAYSGHEGVDLIARDKTVYSTFSVTSKAVRVCNVASCLGEACGYNIDLVAGPYRIRFCHLVKPTGIAVGDSVAPHQAVAQMDNTGTLTSGTHLHYSIHTTSGTMLNPHDYGVNPAWCTTW